MHIPHIKGKIKSFICDNIYSTGKTCRKGCRNSAGKLPESKNTSIPATQKTNNNKVKIPIPLHTPFH